MRIERDYFDDHYSYISEERAKRPIELKSRRTEEIHDSQTCYFCPGNEEMTPKEIGRITDEKGGWKIRWFPNKFPAVSPEQEKAYGFHEVIVETPDPQKQLWDFSDGELVQVLKVYQERIRELQKDPKINYIVAFKNHGFESGASLWHSHTQLIATSMFPSRLKRRLDILKGGNRCVSCDIAGEYTFSAIAEKVYSLKVLENEDFLAFCPKAPRFAMEAWLISKEHQGDFLSFPEGKLAHLAQALGKVLKKLRGLNASYCFSIDWVAERVVASDMHFHLEILPRLHKWGGFELASGDYIIGTSPEAAAEFYRS